ncbi:tRNA 2-selenouridine(34) synthase MnmH [Roseateles sp.]|jgi:tRNA 2-selenouridine synthase|uniref:tRNA 2-selenouridine(34) synthase MnmH n=1 Tax=Roseateles sp. TaxID=1971397 RepID=UPI0037CA8E26
MTSAHTIEVSDALAELSRFDAVIDVRSPSEFAEDHLPGALNWPVLDDEQRRLVGTLYKSSPFEARKIGAALVARNIAKHLDAHAQELPKSWRPLVYCWRGGQRSGAMSWFLGQIGFRSRQLQGGYKAYRAQVRLDLENLPARLRYRVICGRTGSGKTRLLKALEVEGAQVLDLEGLACHRGSVLGALPEQPQPSQKRFDSLLWSRMRSLDPERPVFVESESRKIGQLRVPESLHERMRASSTCIWVDLPEAERVTLLLQDYAHFIANPQAFCQQLDALTTLRGRDRVHGWQTMARAGEWPTVFAELMREHYDPGYERSLRNHYPQLDAALQLPLAGASEQEMRSAARQLLANAN